MAIPILGNSGISFSPDAKAIRTMTEADRYAKTMRRLIKKHLNKPDMRQAVNMYRSPKGYQPWAEHIAISSIIASYYRDASKHDLSPVTAMSAIIALAAQSQSAPPRFLDKELAESFLHTDIPQLQGDDAPPMPLLAMRIFFPAGLLKTDVGFPLDSAIVVDREIVRQVFIQQGNVTDISTIPEAGAGFVMLCLPVTGESFFRDFRWSEERKSDLDVDAGIRAAIDRATAFCAHTILTMVHKPELITTGTTPPATTGQGFATNQISEPLPPVWIGRGYQPRHSKGPRQSSATARSPRPHWRRGHWRHVVYGTGRQGRRLRWIRPVYVNPVATQQQLGPSA